MFIFMYSDCWVLTYPHWILIYWNTSKYSVSSSFKKKERDKIKHHFMSSDNKIYPLWNLELNWILGITELWLNVFGSMLIGLARKFISFSNTAIWIQTFVVFFSGGQYISFCVIELCYWWNDSWIVLQKCINWKHCKACTYIW